MAKQRDKKTSGKTTDSTPTDTKEQLFDDSIRLNVFLQEHGIASRRKADDLIAEGKVKVDGVIIKKLGTRIAPDSKVHVAGTLVRSSQVPKMTVVLNKPDLTLTTRLDQHNRATIFDLPALRNLPRNVQAVGRLDYRSEGLLVLTNDGDLAFALTHPKFSVEKTYAVLLADLINPDDLERLRHGVQLDDGMAKALSVRPGSKETLGRSKGQWLEIIVTEGRNRLIRRMMETLGLKVVRLVRTAVGDLRLPEKLTPGHMQTLTNIELEYLNRIKADMLKTRELAPNLAAAGLSADDMKKRRLKRKIKLSDEEYAEEAVRRSFQADIKRKERQRKDEPLHHTPVGPIPSARRRAAVEDDEAGDSMPTQGLPQRQSGRSTGVNTGASASTRSPRTTDRTTDRAPDRTVSRSTERKPRETERDGQATRASSGRPERARAGEGKSRDAGEHSSTAKSAPRSKPLAPAPASRKPAPERSAAPEKQQSSSKEVSDRRPAPSGKPGDSSKSRSGKPGGAKGVRSKAGRSKAGRGKPGSGKSR